jgi:hypothetical protein
MKPQIYFNIDGWGGGWLSDEVVSRFIHIKCLAVTYENRCEKCGEPISNKVRDKIVALWVWVEPLRIDDANDN